jgi:hypothetical protein
VHANSAKPLIELKLANGIVEEKYLLKKSTWSLGFVLILSNISSDSLYNKIDLIIS